MAENITFSQRVQDTIDYLKSGLINGKEEIGKLFGPAQDFLFTQLQGFQSAIQQNNSLRFNTYTVANFATWIFSNKLLKNKYKGNGLVHGALSGLSGYAANTLVGKITNAPLTNKSLITLSLFHALFAFTINFDEKKPIQNNKKKEKEEKPKKVNTGNRESANTKNEESKKVGTGSQTNLNTSPRNQIKESEIDNEKKDLSDEDSKGNPSQKENNLNCNKPQVSLSGNINLHFSPNSSPGSKRNTPPPTPLFNGSQNPNGDSESETKDENPLRNQTNGTSIHLNILKFEQNEFEIEETSSNTNEQTPQGTQENMSESGDLQSPSNTFENPNTPTSVNVPTLQQNLSTRNNNDFFQEFDDVTVLNFDILNNRKEVVSNDLNFVEKDDEKTVTQNTSENSAKKKDDPEKERKEMDRLNRTFNKVRDSTNSLNGKKSTRSSSSTPTSEETPINGNKSTPSSSSTTKPEIMTFQSNSSPSKMITVIRNTTPTQKTQTVKQLNSFKRGEGNKYLKEIKSDKMLDSQVQTTNQSLHSNGTLNHKFTNNQNTVEQKKDDE